jgi:hypothetical protein
MSKYSYEFKLSVVEEYVRGEDGYGEIGRRRGITDGHLREWIRTRTRAEGSMLTTADEALKESVQMRPGQQLGIDMANNFMLMTLFTIVGDMSEDPDGFRTNVKKALFDLADNYSLPGVAREMANEARDAAKQIIAGVLQNPQPFTPQ